MHLSRNPERHVYIWVAIFYVTLWSMFLRLTSFLALFLSWSYGAQLQSLMQLRSLRQNYLFLSVCTWINQQMGLNAANGFTFCTTCYNRRGVGCYLSSFSKSSKHVNSVTVMLPLWMKRVFKCWIGLTSLYLYSKSIVEVVLSLMAVMLCMSTIIVWIWRFETKEYAVLI